MNLSNNMWQLAPFIVMAAAPLLLIVIIAIKRNHGFSWLYTLLTFLLVTVTAMMAMQHPVAEIPLFELDKFTYFYVILFSTAGFLIVLTTYGYLEKYKEQNDEFYVLIVMATLGSSALVASNNFVSLFLSLEVLSVSLYALIAYLRDNEFGIEAGIKYLILAAMSSSILLFGIALIYLETGTMDFALLAENLNGNLSPWMLAGMAMVVAGAGFKLSVAPFHWWTPDVYQGASSPVTSFIATISKGGMVGVLIRFFTTISIYEYPSLVIAISIIAIVSMFTGNILALQQNNVKRLLAYSSISHLGYILVAFLAIPANGAEAATFYLAAYVATTIGAFGIITILSSREGEPESLESYRGLFWRNPWLAAFFSLIMFSLAGIPLTAGFLGKFYVISAGANAGLWLLLVVLVINSVIGVYYYLRVVTTMFIKEENEKFDTLQTVKLISGAGLTLLIVAAIILWIGILPSSLIEMIRNVVASI